MTSLYLSLVKEKCLVLDFFLEDRGNLTNLLVGQSLRISHRVFRKRHAGQAWQRKPQLQAHQSRNHSLLHLSQSKGILSTSFLYNLISKETSIFLSLHPEGDLSRGYRWNRCRGSRKRIANIGFLLESQTGLIRTSRNPESPFSLGVRSDTCHSFYCTTKAGKLVKLTKLANFGIISWGEFLANLNRFKFTFGKTLTLTNWAW